MKKRILFAMFAMASSLPATTLSTTVTADTYLRNDGNSTTNWNGDADNEMLVGSNGSVDNLRGLLRFSVADITNAVAGTGGGNYANLTINSVTLTLNERRGFARTGSNMIVNSYGSQFVEAASTWVDPDGDGNTATGDATAGGTVGASLGTGTLTWNATADSESLAITLDPSLFKTAIQGAPTIGDINMLIRSTVATTSFVSIKSNNSAGRHATLVVDYTVTPAGGPLLTVDPSTPQPDFTFPLSQTTASPLTRTVRYQNTGSSGTITVQNVTVTNTTGTAFAAGTTSPALPATLAVGQSIDIPVTVSSAAGGAFTGSVFIDTDLNPQDKTLPLAASFYKSGDLYNSNPSTVTDLSNWGGGSTRVTPGLTGITADGMVRVRGVGDPIVPSTKSSHSQSTSVPNGLPDWELDFRFSPVAPGKFIDYTNGAAPDGNFTDRLFQVVVQASDVVPNTINFDSTVDDATLINLAYMPDGITTGGIAGFYLFDGTTDTWQLVDFNGDGSALVLAGSTDVDTDADLSNGVGDGTLDATTSDTVNVYRLSIRGQDFGSGSATYDLTLTGPGGLSKTKTGLTISHNQAITTGTPAGYAFVTSDTSTESNTGNGLSPSFWVDEVGYFAVQRPAQRLLVFNPPTLLRSLNGSTPTHVVTALNDGASAPVNLSASLTGTSAVTLQSPPAFPVSIAAGAQSTLTLGLNPSLLTSPDTAAAGTFSLTSDDPLLASVNYPLVATKVTDANLVANGDFESATGTGTFPVGWTPTGIPSSIASFLPSGGGAAAVSLAPSQGILQDIAPTAADGLDDFQTDFAFQIGNETQAHRIRMEGDNGGDLVTIRLTTSPTATDTIDVFNAGTFVSALSGLTIAPNTTYYLRVIGRQFSQTGRKYTIGFSTDGITYTTSAYMIAFHATAAAKFETATLECGATAGSSLSIENVMVKAAPPADLATWISGYTFAPGADTSATGDADGDGISNLVENVLGTAPNAASSGLTQIGGTGTSVTFSHPLNAELASDVTYSYQWSTDLAEWKSSGQSNTGGIATTITAGAPVSGVVTVTASVTTGTASKLFVRLIANQAP